MAANSYEHQLARMNEWIKLMHKQTSKTMAADSYMNHQLARMN